MRPARLAPVSLAAVSVAFSAAPAPPARGAAADEPPIRYDIPAFERTVDLLREDNPFARDHGGSGSTRRSSGCPGRTT